MLYNFNLDTIVSDFTSIEVEENDQEKSTL